MYNMRLFDVEPIVLEIEHRGCTVRKISSQCVSHHLAEEKKRKSQAVDPKVRKREQ